MYAPNDRENQAVGCGLHENVVDNKKRKMQLIPQSVSFCTLCSGIFLIDNIIIYLNDFPYTLPLWVTVQLILELNADTLIVVIQW